MTESVRRHAVPFVQHRTLKPTVRAGPVATARGLEDEFEDLHVRLVAVRAFGKFLHTLHPTHKLEVPGAQRPALSEKWNSCNSPSSRRLRGIVPDRLLLPRNSLVRLERLPSSGGRGPVRLW